MEPGWHPDPFGRHPFRFWDGNAWTEHVGTADAQTTDPPVPSPPSATALASAPPAPVPVATPAPQVVEISRRYLCARHGVVTPIPMKGRDATTKVKKASVGKIAAGVATAGTSMLFTGVRSKKNAKTTVLVCPQCKREVVEG